MYTVPSSHNERSVTSLNHTEQTVCLGKISSLFQC